MHRLWTIKRKTSVQQNNILKKSMELRWFLVIIGKTKMWYKEIPEISELSFYRLQNNWIEIILI